MLCSTGSGNIELVGHGSLGSRNQSDTHRYDRRVPCVETENEAGRRMTDGGQTYGSRQENERKIEINFPKDWYVVWMQNWTPHLICYHSMASDYVPMALVVMLAS